jgi:hypothetical protein
MGKLILLMLAFIRVIEMISNAAVFKIYATYETNEAPLQLERRTLLFVGCAI